MSNFFSYTKQNLVHTSFSLKLSYEANANVQYLNELDKSVFRVLLENWLFNMSLWKNVFYFWEFKNQSCHFSQLLHIGFPWLFTREHSSKYSIQLKFSIYFSPKIIKWNMILKYLKYKDSATNCNHLSRQRKCV